MASIHFDKVSKVYGDGTLAVQELDLEIAEGEFVVLVGPSGCGKTTALRMVAGLEEISDGEIRIGDRVVNDLAPRERDVAMVFQSYALYPHMSVRQNIAFGLRMRKVTKADQHRRVEEIAKILGLTEHLDRRPAQLSGGQRQRVAMGRAIVREPRAFLMDEPLSNLDAKLRVQMRAEIARIQRRLKVTTLYVTHDQVEAMTMADRVAVMRRGILQQTDAPQRVYESPANLFVASFVGSPPMNLLEARLERSPSGLLCRLGRSELEVGLRPELERFVGRTIGLGVRPEHVREVNGDDGDRRLQGEVLLVEALGAELLVHVAVNAQPLLVEDVLEGAGDDEAALPTAATTEGETTILARFDAESRIREGDRVELAFDARRLHFFDLETGRSIRPIGAPVPAGVAG
ncbi:MAG TPA: sn-glycerol-3-phosphate ABC transporter ATP-binding protein UgpC [Gaiellaceae bacterium]